MVEGGKQGTGRGSAEKGAPLVEANFTVVVSSRFLKNTNISLPSFLNHSRWARSVFIFTVLQQLFLLLSSFVSLHCLASTQSGPEAYFGRFHTNMFDFYNTSKIQLQGAKMIKDYLYPPPNKHFFCLHILPLFLELSSSPSTLHKSL